MTFREFIQAVRPNYKFYWHAEILIARLQDVADGKIKRLLVFMPPRHGKSELVSRLFPAYIQYSRENEFVGINSYSAGLAIGFGRNAREFYRRVGGAFQVEASNHWEATHGGGVWSAGVGGPITGKGMQFGEIDDPLKNAKEASSEIIREKQWEWYQSTFYTRMEPDAAIIITLTRWNEDDLAGRVIKEELIGDEEPERWHIIHFEAIKSKEAMEYPASCTVEPDPRKPGEALCPERYPIEKLNRIKLRVGSFYWSALYQQNPQEDGGNVIKREWIKRYEALPKGNHFQFITMDPTFDDTKDSDYVVAVSWARIGVDFYVLDVLRKQLSFVDTVKEFISFCNVWPLATAKLIEKKANGAAINSLLSKKIPGIITWDPGQNSKENRFKAVAPFFEAGNIYVPARAHWVEGWIKEHCAFPRGKHDDQVDNTSMALLHYGNKQDFNKLIDRFR